MVHGHVYPSPLLQLRPTGERGQRSLHCLDGLSGQWTDNQAGDGGGGTRCRGGVVNTALIKGYRCQAECERELLRTRHKLMQAMRGEEIRARTKVSAHRRPKRGHHKETVHANIGQYTISQYSQQLQQACLSVWIDNHDITSATTTSTTQQSEPRPLVSKYSCRAPVARKAGRDHGPSRKALAARPTHSCTTRT